MKKIQRRDFLKAMGLATAALGLTACGGSGSSGVSGTPASGSSAPATSAQLEATGEKAAPTGALVTQFQTGELTIGDYTFKAEYIPFDVRREVGGAHHLVHADSYQGNYFFSFYNEDDEEQSAKTFEYAIRDDRLTPVAEYNIDSSNALSIDRNGVLYAMDTFDVYCYDLDSSGDYYLAAFDLDGNELARSTQPVGSFDAVMMKRPNGYLLDTGYVWELYGPDGTFLEKSLPVGEHETLCQLCGDFCTFDVFLPLEENAFLAVGHHGKASEPDEPVVFRITTDF